MDATRGKDFGTSFTQARRAGQTMLDQFAQDRPDLYWGASAAGTFTPLGLIGKGIEAAGAVKTAIQGAKSGAVMGSVAGFGESQHQDIPGRLGDVIPGAIGGAATGAVVAPFASRLADYATPTLKSGVSALGDRMTVVGGVAKPAFTTAADAGQYVGQAFAGNAQALRTSAEDAYTKSAQLGATVAPGIVGQMPGEIDNALAKSNSFRPSQLDAAQFPAAARAWEIINKGVESAGQTALPQGAGLAPSINIAAGTAQYRASLAARGGLSQADQNQLVSEYQRLATQFNNGQLKDLSQISALGAPVPGGAGFAIDSQVGTGTPSIREIQRQLNSKDDRGLIPKDSNDAMRLGDIRRAYDQAFAALDPYVVGPPNAVAAAREGNKLWSQYMTLTNPKPGDRAGNVVARFVDGNMSGQQVADVLMGGVNAASVNPNAAQDSVMAVQRLKTVFGEKSQEFNAIQQGAFLRLVGDNPKTAAAYTPQQIKQNIRAFTESTNGAPLAQNIFTVNQLAALRRFGNSIPDKPIAPGSPGAFSLRTAATTLASVMGFTYGAGSGADFLAHLMPGMPFIAESAPVVGLAAGAAANTFAERAFGNRGSAMNPLLDRPLWAARGAGALTRDLSAGVGGGPTSRPFAPGAQPFAPLPTTQQSQQQR